MLLCCQELPFSEVLRFIGRIFRLLLAPLPFDALNEGILFGMRKLEWLVYNLVKVAR